MSSVGILYCFFVVIKLVSLVSSCENTSTISIKNRLDSSNGEMFDPLPSIDCQSSPQSGMPFCNPSLSFMERAEDLVSRLTTKEKIDQTSTIAPAISRLGIKDYNWRSNCLHGWSLSGGHWTKGMTWTVFPSPINLGATFDYNLILRVGQVTADEGRALHNEMMAANSGSSTEAAGLNCFSPNVNLFRDPRWGRGQETFGEDPYLISLVGAAYTRGLQEGDNKKYLKIAACAKHYSVHSGPEEARMHFKANVSLHDLYDTFLPAFKSQVLGAHVAQMMPALSGLRCKYQPDGAPDVANPFLLKSVLREQFGADNISIVSDNAAIAAVNTYQKYVSSMELAAALAMNATTDLDLGFNVYPEFLPEALNHREVTMQSITNAVVRSFYLRMMLGDFDPPSMVPYQLIDKSHLDTPQNQALNLQAARESIVLLKNVKNSLPLDPKGIKNIAVIGPNANKTDTLLSNYQGVPSKIVSILEGISEVLSSSNGTVVNYASVCLDVRCEDISNANEALKIVNSADFVVMVMGLDPTVEAEAHDRAQTQCNGINNDILELPGCQGDVIKKVIEMNSKVILVLINGGPVTVAKQLLEDDRIIGIIEAFYPGALGGTAVADVLFGNYNPGGRMPVTTYLSSDELPPAVDYNMTTPPGRTYRYYTGTPVFPFGYGLSYTSFEYSKLTVTPTKISTCDSVKVTVSVHNSGEMAGDEVIQIYLAPPRRSDKAFFPNVQLVGFERVHIKAGVVQMAAFELNPYLLSLVDEDGEHYIFPGDYTVLSSNQPGEDAIQATFSITGTAPVKTAMCTSSPQCLAC